MHISDPLWAQVQHWNEESDKSSLKSPETVRTKQKNEQNTRVSNSAKGFNYTHTHTHTHTIPFGMFP